MTYYWVNEEKATLKQVGEARIQSHHKYHPWHGDLPPGGNSKPEELRVTILYQASQLLRHLLER